MAYDANDPADKKIVQDLIDEALEEAANKHEEEIAGLKTKNKDLIDRIKKLRASSGDGDPEEVSRLEAELEEKKTLLKAAEKD